MAPQKKMTLQEFFSDKSLGGSWADDDIDIASISVPIERNKYHPISKDPFGGPGLGGGYSRGVSHFDGGPPFIVKLLNLPISCDDLFVEDLFRSRYTPFVKFKIVVDPSSNVLETHIVRKVAFVELTTSQDMAKVMKWQDLYYKASRRVIIEPADFNDFQHCISFNQEHAEEIAQIEDDLFNGRNTMQPPPPHHSHPRHLNLGHPSPAGHALFKPRPPAKVDITDPSYRGPILGSTNHSEGKDLQSSSKPVLGPKPNPFGAAKPVDILAKQSEIDKKLVAINHTTIKTLGAVEQEAQIGAANSRRKSIDSQSHGFRHRDEASAKKYTKNASVNILKRSLPQGQNGANDQKTDSKSGGGDGMKPAPAPAPAPGSVYAESNSGLSLAQMLSTHGGDSRDSSKRGLNSSTNSPKPEPKPVILKKKAIDNVQSEEKKIDNATNQNSGELASNNDSNEESRQSSSDKDKENKSQAHGSITGKDSKNHEKEGSSPTANHIEEHKDFKNEALISPSAGEENQKGAPKIADGEGDKDRKSNHQTNRAKVPYRSSDRPNFKEHFVELDRKQHLLRESLASGQSSRKLHGSNRRRNSASRDYNGAHDDLNGLVRSDSRGTDVSRPHDKHGKRQFADSHPINKDEIGGRNSRSYPKKFDRQHGRRKHFDQTTGQSHDDSEATDEATKKPDHASNDIKDEPKSDVIVGKLNECADKDGFDVPDEHELEDKNAPVSTTKNELKKDNANATEKDISLNETKQFSDDQTVSDKLKGLDVKSPESGDGVDSSPDDKTGKGLGRVSTRRQNKVRGSRGSFHRGRGNGRGLRAHRGRGNFNLHYVRSKEESSEA